RMPDSLEPARRNCASAPPGRRSCTRALAYKDFVPRPSLAKRLKRWVRYWLVRIALAGVAGPPGWTAGSRGRGCRQRGLPLGGRRAPQGARVLGGGLPGEIRARARGDRLKLL